jgi:hypothetical protein
MIPAAAPPGPDAPRRWVTVRRMRERNGTDLISRTRDHCPSGSGWSMRGPFVVALWTASSPSGVSRRESTPADGGAANHGHTAGALPPSDRTR